MASCWGHRCVSYFEGPLGATNRHMPEKARAPLKCPKVSNAPTTERTPTTARHRRSPVTRKKSTYPLNRAELDVAARCQGLRWASYFEGPLDATNGHVSNERKGNRETLQVASTPAGRRGAFSPTPLLGFVRHWSVRPRKLVCPAAEIGLPGRGNWSVRSEARKLEFHLGPTGFDMGHETSGAYRGAGSLVKPTCKLIVANEDNYALAA